MLSVNLFTYLEYGCERDLTRPVGQPNLYLEGDSYVFYVNNQ